LAANHFSNNVHVYVQLLSFTQYTSTRRALYLVCSSEF